MTRYLSIVLGLSLVGCPSSGARLEDAHIDDASLPFEDAHIDDASLPFEDAHVDDAFAPDASTAGCRMASCWGSVFACGNCADDDSDGLVDEVDPDCYGPCDTNEDYFHEPRLTTTDTCSQPLPCLFNFRRGSCALSRFCYGENHCPMDPARCFVSADAECLDWCMPFVPNGCDCFGCCEVPGSSGAFVRIRNEDGAPAPCGMATLADPVACRPCTPSPECFNSCEACELCMGRRLPSAGCTADQRCSSGAQPCGVPGDAACPEDYDACIGGCCVHPMPIR